MKLYPLGDEIGCIELINSMGDDLSVVNDAKVSYNNHSDKLGDKEIKLINYLIKHKHYSPLRGVVFKFRCKVPLSTARQWFKHHVASSYVSSQNAWNEISFRYTNQENAEFYIPQRLRLQSTANKQGSAGFIDQDTNKNLCGLLLETSLKSLAVYKHLITLGVAREQARDALPANIYTSFIWTTSLEALLNFISLRTGAGAQSEISRYAEAIAFLINPIVPETLKAYELHR